VLRGRAGARAGLVAAFAVTMLGTTLPTPLYVLYREKFGFSELVVTIIFAVYAVGVMATLVGFGRVSDDMGRRPVLLAGLGLSAGSAVVFLLADGVGLLLVGRFVSGMSAGVFTGTATAALLDVAEPDGEGRATLLATVANMGGLGCGPLLAGVLADVVDDPLHVVFVVDLVLVALAVVATALVRGTRGRDAAPPTPVRLRPQWPTVPPPARGLFVSAAIAGFAGFAVLGLFTAVAPAFLGQVLGVHGHATVGAIVFGVFIASTLGQTGVGRVGIRAALLGGCVALVAGMIVLGSGLAVRSTALLVAGGLVAGAGQGLSFRAGLGAVSAATPDAQRAAVASAFFLVAYVAISLPVVGVGAMAEAASLRTAGLVFTAIVAVLAALAFGLLRRR